MLELMGLFVVRHRGEAENKTDLGEGNGFTTIKKKMVASKKSPTGPTERTPSKPEYLMARSQLT